MVTERRQTPRATPYEPVYVSFPSQNHGIVVDASENGLQFRADAPIQHYEGGVPVRFTFSPFAEMETIGEIIWMDEENKTGGLRFKDLPGPDRSNIRRWLEQNALPLPPRADLTVVEKVSTGAGATNEIPSEPMVLAADGAGGATIGETPQREASRAGAFTSSSEFTEPWRPPAGARLYQTEVPRNRIRTVVLTIVGLVFVAIFSLGLFLYWRTGGGTQSLGQVLSDLHLAGSESYAQSSPADSEVSPLLRPASKPHRVRPVGAGNDTGLPLLSSAGGAELANALQYLSGDEGRAEPAVAVKWLWAAEKKGNPQATVLLANLYAWGRGVPQNCEQARVLLIAASNRGSAEAAQQLQDMESDGCGSVTASSK
jgi:hypothetical protein